LPKTCRNTLYFSSWFNKLNSKSEGIPRQAEVPLEIPGRLRLRIFSTFGTTSVVGRQPNAPAAFTSGEIPGTHFQRLSRPQGTWFCRKEPRKKSQVTPPGIDPGTIRLVAQYLNHYVTPGPIKHRCKAKKKKKEKNKINFVGGIVTVITGTQHNYHTT
jgi:hypothetical protein